MPRSAIGIRLLLGSNVLTPSRIQRLSMSTRIRGSSDFARILSFRRWSRRCVSHHRPHLDPFALLYNRLDESGLDRYRRRERCATRRRNQGAERDRAKRLQRASLLSVGRKTLCNIPAIKRGSVRRHCCPAVVFWAARRCLPRQTVAPDIAKLPLEHALEPPSARRGRR